MTAPTIALPLVTGAVNVPCAKSVGAEPDRTIHGRLSVYNGGYPNHRLWEVGTHHLYAIYGDAQDAKHGPGDREEDTESFPKNVEDAFARNNAFQVRLFADFVIRPLKKLKVGSMQPACIVSADHLIRKVD